MIDHPEVVLIRNTESCAYIKSAVNLYFRREEKKTGEPVIKEI